MYSRTHTRSHFIKWAVALTLFLMIAGISVAQGEGTSDDKAKAILDRYVEVTGGQEAYDAIKSIYSEATLEMPAMGLALNIKVWTTRDNRFLSIVHSEATGEIRRGWNGSVFWENSVMTGPRILEGDELAQAIREAKLEKYVYWRDTYASAAYGGEETFDSVLCDKVILTPAEGAPSTLFFSKETGFIVGEQSTIQHQMGEIPVTAYISDYREVNGFTLGFTTTMNIMGQERSIVVSKVEHNVETPDSLFALPVDVQELLEGDSEAEG